LKHLNNDSISENSKYNQDILFNQSSDASDSNDCNRQSLLTRFDQSIHNDDNMHEEKRC
jgi:hypothetical protein